MTEKIYWRPSSFSPHTLKINKNNTAQLISTHTGEKKDVFLAFKQPIVHMIDISCDIAEPRDLGLQYLVMTKGVQTRDESRSELNLNKFLHDYIDEMHPMTPYRFFILQPDMCSDDPVGLYAYLTASNINFTGLSLL